MIPAIGVILAAGLGTRLRPSTEKCPKPLIPVGGIEPLYYALYQFERAGIHRVVVNAHYLSEKIADALAKWKKSFPLLQIRFEVEMPLILGTGGAIINIVQKNKDWFRGAGLILQNGDTLTNIDLKKLFAKRNESTFAISTLPVHLKKYNPLWLDKKGHWAGIGKIAPRKELKAAHFLGVHYLSPKAVQELLNSKKYLNETNDLFNAIYRPLSDEGHTFSAQDLMPAKAKENFWFDMTTQEFLLEAQRHVLSTMSKSKSWSEALMHRHPSIKEIEPGIWVLRRGEQSQFSYLSPVVLVESAQVKGKKAPSGRDVGHVTLGPHASLINEHGFFKNQTQKKHLAISNSVVLVGTEERATLPESIKDEICIL